MKKFSFIAILFVAVLSVGWLGPIKYAHAEEGINLQVAKKAAFK